jgi:signal transduction histidine kinase
MTDGVAGEVTASRMRAVAADEHAPQAARSFVRRVCGDGAADLLSVTDELVSNAVRHAGGTSIGVSLQRVAEGVLVEVADGDRGHPPQPRDAADLDDSGRGLRIVEALSVRWGWRPAADGKAVYAVVA